MRIPPPQVYTMWILRLAQVFGHLYVLPLPLEVQIPAPSFLSLAGMKLNLGVQDLFGWVVGLWQDIMTGPVPEVAFHRSRVAGVGELGAWIKNGMPHYLVFCIYCVSR